MKNYTTIEVTMKSGKSAMWLSDNEEWDDYAYDGNVFAIKCGGKLVGIYNMDCVESVVVR